MSCRVLAFAAAITISPMAWANWTYGERVQEMSGKPETWAELRSASSLNLRAPYDGPNFATLNIRRSASRLIVWIEIEKGQFVCSVSGCQIEVRFDDKPPSRFNVQGPADYNSRILVLLDGKRFVTEASKTNATIRVAATMHREGAPVMMFESSVPLYLGKPK